MNERLLNILIEALPQIAWQGIKTTIPLSILAFAFGLTIALVVALIQITNVKILTQIVKFYVWIFRGTPLLVQLFIIFFGLPSVGITLDAFPAAVIAFSLNVGAYTSETLRAAILSVPAGQIEAGYTIGMNYFQIMTHVVLPQAFRVAFPPLFNSLIGLTKDTSVAASITVADMFLKTQQIAARTYEPFALYCEVAVLYLLLSTLLGFLQHYGERKLSANLQR